MNMDQPQITHLEDGWVIVRNSALVRLETALDENFLAKSKDALFSRKEYADTYTLCYNMCTQRTPYNWSEQLYQRHGDTVARYLTESVLPAIESKAGGQDLLRELVYRSENHKIMNKWLKNFFMYLDRYYVKYHSLPNLEESGVRHFKTLVFDKIKERAANAVMALIDEERAGNDIPQDLIVQTVHIFESMGMGALDTYIMDFEQPLLSSSRRSYQRLSETWITQDDTPAYLKKAERALEEEKQRVERYLNPDTEPKLLRVVEEETLAKREEELLTREGSGCKVLLSNDMTDDLSRMFRLFNRVPGGLEPMARLFQEHVTNLGQTKIFERQARLEASTDKESNEDPQLIKDLLSLHEKFQGVVNAQFEGNSLFQKALKEAFSEIVNQDTGKVKTAELLSSYCDRILKSGSAEKLSESEIDAENERAVQLFSYLTDKDLFCEIYRNQLAKRLLNQRSSSADCEKNMIGKLKGKQGAQFTSKLEGMFNDLAVASDFGPGFAKFLKEHHTASIGKIDFSVQLLTGGHWPTYKVLDLTLPPIMAKCQQIFKEYHETVNSTRKLTWQHSLGNATVKGAFGKKTTELQVTTLQAMVLLEFNVESGTRSFEYLAQSLSCDVDVMKRIVHSLACNAKLRILKKVLPADMSAADLKASDKKVEPTDVFVHNEAFSSPLKKVRVPMASIEDSHNSKRIDEDRTMLIEACVVRIMKARRTLAHQQLVSEVMEQLNTFRPDGKLVKMRIEALIERDYLERDADDPQTYKYLA